EIARRGLENDRAARDLAHPDVPVRGLGDDTGARLLDGDAAVGRVEPRVAAGQTDPRIAVGVLDHRAAVELAQPHLARAGGDLGVARRALDADVAHAALQLQCAGPVDLDATEARLDPAVAELAVTANVGQGPRAADHRAGRQLDGHVDRPAALPAQPRAELRALDQQQLVRV